MDQRAEQRYQEVFAGAGGALKHADTLRMLITAAFPSHEQALHDLGFKAKFLVRTWGVMQRLGAKDPARDKLKIVFQEELESVRSLLKPLTVEFASADREEFARRFLAIDGAAFVRMLELLHDLAWIQNVALDRKT